MAGTYSIYGLGAKLALDIYSVVEGEVYNICEKALRDEVNRTVYAGGGDGRYYNRTMGILNAIEIVEKHRSSTSISFKVIINPARIGIEITSPDMLNAHADVYGQDFRTGLIPTLDEGSSGSTVYNFSGYHFFDSTYQNLDSKLIGVMASALSSKGWDVTTY